MSLEKTEQFLVNDAEDFVKTLYRGRGEDYSGQLRKFFNDFKLLERRMLEDRDMTEEEFKKSILPQIKYTKVKIAYNAGRKGSGGKLLIPKEFYKHISDLLTKIEAKTDFEAFLKHYQAIIAFNKYQKEVEEKSQSNHPRNAMRGGENRGQWRRN